jgi:putative heme-binding domain-containing protein
MNTAGGVLARLGLGLLLAGALSAQSSTVNLKDPGLIARGSELFAKSCATGYCHGSEGRAGRGPQLREREWQPRQVFNIANDGIPNTTMPPFKNLLPRADLWAVVAYVMTLSSNKLTDDAALIDIGATDDVAVKLTDVERHGRDLFFDLTNQQRCAVCHRLGSRGAAIGPDLAQSAKDKSEKKLLQDIVKPNDSITKGFGQTDISTNQGERIAGVLKEETKEFVKIYDTAGIPPALRTIYRDQIHAMDQRKRSSMPGDFQKIYSGQELKAIVAYLKSGKF